MAAPLLAALLTACAPQSQPRTFFDFMEDGYAREGVLARCNRARDATLMDAECANARRAAAAIALRDERAQAEALARQSEAKLWARREQESLRVAAAREAEAAARAEAQAAYEARWAHDPAAPRIADEPAQEPAPVFGAPLGPVLPSIGDFTSLEGSDLDGLGGLRLETGPAELPVTGFFIPKPTLEVLVLAAAPGLLRDVAAQ